MIALLALLSMLAVVATPQVDTADALVRLDCARGILWRGTIALEKEHAESQLSPVGRDGLRYSIYPIGQSLILIPFDAAAWCILAPLGRSENSYFRDVIVAAAYLATVTFMTGVVLIWVMRRMGLSSRTAAKGVVVCYLCTQWMVWSRSMQEEVLAGLLLLAALGCILEYRVSGRIKWALLTGLLLGMLSNVRYNAVFPALALTGWSFFAVSHRDRWLVFWTCCGLTLAPWLALGGWYNFARFGEVATTGYAAADAAHGGIILSWQFSVASLAGWIAGTDYGILWFWLPAGLCAAAFWSSRRRPRMLAAFTACTLLAHLWLLSGFPHGAGVHGCVGPRFVCHHMMLLLPQIWVACRALALRGGMQRRAAIAVMCVSAAVQGCCLPLSAGLETMQALARAEAGLESGALGYLPSRIINLGRLLGGTLAEYSYPPVLNGRVIARVNTPESYRTATSPHFLPWRVGGGIRARQHLPGWAAAAAWACWSVALIGAGVLVRRVLQTRLVRGKEPA
ncbi:hypothetical protein EDM80_02100 [bacterium]|nr:MAG: hypothetical protein EDM80_02100 [bacterium]RIK62360.1 MAG: hypothetical protein DCC64_10565 [Planctomycetota bacterium]